MIATLYNTNKEGQEEVPTSPLRARKEAALALIVLETERKKNNPESRGVDLSEVVLGNIYLPYADLSGVDFNRADLGGADLREADLRGAHLREADLGGAKLLGADLREADLRGAKLLGADLRETDLRGAMWLILEMITEYANRGETAAKIGREA